MRPRRISEYATHMEGFALDPARWWLGEQDDTFMCIDCWTLNNRRTEYLFHTVLEAKMHQIARHE